VILSFCLTALTNPGEIPNNQVI